MALERALTGLVPEDEHLDPEDDDLPDLVLDAIEPYGEHPYP